jgi:hypothetical protein
MSIITDLFITKSGNFATPARGWSSEASAGRSEADPVAMALSAG